MRSAIREFCNFIGVAKTNSRHAIELLESFIRAELNRTSLRRMAVLQPVKLVITNWPEGQVDTVTLQNNPENEADGAREVPFTGELFIEADDFMAEAPPKYFRLTPGGSVRIRNAGFLTCTRVEKNSAGEVTNVICKWSPPSAEMKVKGIAKFRLRLTVQTPVDKCGKYTGGLLLLEQRGLLQLLTRLFGSAESV